jgi:hypothetical protein
MKTSLALLVLATLAVAGPPAVCWTVEIGGAATLPGKSADVVEDALHLLDGKMPVLVRMETLRRAALQLEESRGGRDALLRRLMVRVLDAEAAGKPSALAWFDAGYAAGCFNQLRNDWEADGYPWVQRAIALSGDGQMEYAGCLLTLMGTERQKQFHAHLERMKEAAAKDPLLAKNLATFQERYPPVLRYFEERAKRKTGE